MNTDDRTAEHSTDDEDGNEALTGDEDVFDVIKDLLFYAPIGLILDAQAVTPDLAKRGRQHTAAARHIGELAVKQGLRRVDALLGQANAARDSDDTPTAPPPSEQTDTRADASGTSADHLAIPEYDLLAASQVVKRLDALSPEELEDVRQYEAATRDRRTILHKISRLQDS
ncbi:MAG: hypothetical protein ACR2N9_05075 [Acidimicrobiia bacterium]